MNYEVEIEKLRKQLDTIDDELISLLIRRFNVTSQVGKLKASHNMTIVDHQREAIILNKVKEKIENQTKCDQDHNLTYIIHVYEEIMKQSKQQQFKE